MTGVVAGTVKDMIKENPETSSLTEEGAAFLWEAQPQMRAELAAGAPLGKKIRESIIDPDRKDKEAAKVREAFAGRGDITPEELTKILTTEKSSLVKAAATHKKIDPSILEDLTEKGTAVLMGALLTRWSEVELTASTTATMRVIAWADKTDIVGRKLDAAIYLMRRLSTEQIDLLPALPQNTRMRVGLYSNPNIWTSQKADLILAQALAGRQYSELDNSIRQAGKVPLTRTQTRLIKDAIGKFPQRWRSLMEATITSEEKEAEEKAEAKRQEEADAGENRYKLLMARCGGADLVLARAALVELQGLKERGIRYNIDEAFYNCLGSPVMAEETLLRVWGKIPPEAQRTIPQLLDPRPALDLMLENSGSSGSTTFVRVLSQSIKDHHDKASGLLLSNWVAENVELLRTKMAVNMVASFVTRGRTESFSRLTVGSLRAFKDYAPFINAWVANQLAAISTQTGKTPIEVYDMANNMATSPSITLGAVLAGIKDSLAAETVGLEKTQEVDGHTVIIPATAPTPAKTRGVIKLHR